MMDGCWDGRTTVRRLNDFLGVVNCVPAATPDEPRLWHLKGLVCKTLRRDTEGIAAFTRAIEPSRAETSWPQSYGATG